VAVRSESFDETLLTDLLEERLASAGHLTLDRVGDNLVARTTLGRPHRVVLAGHTDTVPADGNEVPQLDGDTLWGLGAADMKGGLAVMVRLAELHAAPAVDVTYVFYAREEVAGHHSGLGELAAERPELLTGDVAVLGEPTNGDVEAGCQGTVRVRVVLRGARAHLARAWMGRNAIHRLGGLLTAVDSWTPRQPVLSGCSYHESLQVVAVKGGVAGNVVPDEVVLELGHRTAPPAKRRSGCSASSARTSRTATRWRWSTSPPVRCRPWSTRSWPGWSDVTASRCGRSWAGPTSPASRRWVCPR